MKRFLWLAFLGVLGAFVLRTYAVEGVYIATASMEPRLPVGTHVFINKLAYRWKVPQRGDVVSFPSPVEKKGLVKRVIAVGGDRLLIKNKKLVLNDVPQREIYVVHTRANEILNGDNMDFGAVPPGFVVLMGDNRDQSEDSRDWVDPTTSKTVPFFPVDKIDGKVINAR